VFTNELTKSQSEYIVQYYSR